MGIFVGIAIDEFWDIIDMYWEIFMEHKWDRNKLYIIDIIIYI